MVVDTDTAGDDCLALLVALLDPVADLRAITVCAGNVGFDRQVTNALLTLNAAGRLGEVPVHPGARQPLARAWVSAEDVFGDGLGGLTADLGDHGPSEPDAVAALIAASHEHVGELVVVCIAPLTNIALAVRRDPGFAHRVARLVVMGGSNNGRGNITAAAEYNFYVDPEAAAVVFGSGAAITVVPWAPVTLTDACFDEAERSMISAVATPLAAFFDRAVAQALAFDTSVGIHGSTHPDSLTAAIALHPGLATTAPYHVAIETTSQLTRGYAAMSWGVHGLTPNADVVERADRPAFHALLRGLLSDPRTPNVPFHPPLR